MSRMQTGASRRASFQCDDALLDEFDELCDEEDKSRSEKLRELVADAVDDGATDDDRDEYLPADENERAIYEACVEYANKPSHVLRYDRHDGQIAQRTGVSKSNLKSWLHVLERKGYVRQQEGGPMDNRPRDVYRVKPRCADPEQWTYSRAAVERTVEIQA